MMPSSERMKGWEAHFRTIVAAVILGGIGWVLKVSHETHAGLEVLRAENSVQFTNLRREIDELKAQTQGVYTSADAERDFQRWDERFRELQERVKELERERRDGDPHP